MHVLSKLYANIAPKQMFMKGIFSQTLFPKKKLMQSHNNTFKTFLNTVSKKSACVTCTFRIFKVEPPKSKGHIVKLNSKKYCFLYNSLNFEVLGLLFGIQNRYKMGSDCRSARDGSWKPLEWHLERFWRLSEPKTSGLEASWSRLGALKIA